MPVINLEKTILEKAYKFIRLKQSLIVAKVLVKTKEINVISSEMAELEKASDWQEIDKEIRRLELEMGFITEDLKKKPLNQGKLEIQSKNSVEIDSLRKQYAYDLAVHLIDCKRKEVLEFKRIGKREALLAPLLSDYLHSFRVFTHQTKGFHEHSNIKTLKKAIRSDVSLEILKDNILAIIDNQKQFRRDIYSSDIDAFCDWVAAQVSPYDSRSSLPYNLNKVKKNINLELYPTFGRHIDHLENYIRNLKQRQSAFKASQYLFFKSNQSKKLEIAEKLYTDLINFEKNSKNRDKSSLTVIDIENLIRENTEATGSHYLHGKGKLDKILNNVKEEIDFSINKNPNEKVKAEHLKVLEKKALKEALAKDSGHLFRKELDVLTKFIQGRLNSGPRTFNHDIYNPKKDIKIAKQLRILLLNSDNLSDEKRDILQSRINTSIIASLTPNWDFQRILEGIERVIEATSKRPKL